MMLQASIHAPTSAHARGLCTARGAAPLAHHPPRVRPSRGHIVIRRFKEKEGEQLAGNEQLTQERGRVGTIQGTPAQSSVGYAVMGQKEALRPWLNDMPRELQPNEIDIKVTHNGVCHSDLHMQHNDWGISKFPFIPGHEVVGTVAAKGSQVSGLEVGQRVGVGWIKSSCRRCAGCLRGEENICDKGYTGLIVAGGNGGFQDVLRAPADFAYAIPEGLDSAHAAPLLCAGITVYAPLKRHITRPGMRVAVLGLGGLGHLAVQYAAALGGVVDALDIAPDKADEARKLGATGFVVFTDDAQVASKHNTYDLIINCASARVDTSKLLALLRNDGTLVQVGIPGGATMSLPLQDLVFGQKRVVGSIVGGRSDMASMLQLSAAKGIKPMIEMMKLSQVNEALARVASGKARYRVVLERDELPRL